jgi:alpha-1,3-fucosyltransferase 10
MIPSSRDTLWQQALGLIDDARYAEAVAVLGRLRERLEREATTEPTLGPGCITLADLSGAMATCHFRLGRHAMAAECYRQAAEAAPDNAEYRVKRDLCASLARKDVGEATSEAQAGKPPLILLANDFPGAIPSPIACPRPYRLTRDPALRGEADAIVYHIPGLEGRPELTKRPDQLAVAICMESVLHYPLLNDPDFMAQFDLTMTYQRSADIWCAYVDPESVRMMRRTAAPKTAAAPAVCFVSNSRCTTYDRPGYLQALMQHLPIDAFGRDPAYRPLENDRGRVTKLEVSSRYKFTLAFENAIDQDYVSEKFFDPLMAGSVPVYLGAPNIDAFAPAEHCFVNAADFATPRDLARFLSDLAADDARYEQYHAWRSEPFRSAFLAAAEAQRHDALCRLAQHIVEGR